MPDATLTIIAEEPLGTISPLLHGHFAEHLGRCCNDGLWVGADSAIPNTDGLRTDVLAALRELDVPLLRWPGGCYADTYHWRDGIGPRDRRPRSLGESCGLSVVEDNGLGTHEFVALCRAIGAEPYLAGNVGTGTPQEMMDWVHYCNGSLDTTLAQERATNGHAEPMNVRYWGVGNENWGCGGNFEAVDYAKEYRRYATFLRMADPRAELVACGHNSREWNLRVVETLRGHLNLLDHLSVHQYYAAGDALDFSEEEYYRVMGAGTLIEGAIRYTDEILRFFTAGKRKVGIAFDEWGVWHPQARKHCDYEAPNTLRDAVAGAGVLDTFHRWCDRLSMANLAQIVNVLQCLIQTREDRMWLTPTYHLFRLYRGHQGGTSLRVEVACPSVDSVPLGDPWNPPSGAVAPLPLVSATASLKDGALTVSATNRHRDDAMTLRIVFRGVEVAGGGAVLTLSGDTPAAENSADRPDRVGVTERHTGDVDGGAEMTLEIPPCSVQTVTLKRR